MQRPVAIILLLVCCVLVLARPMAAQEGQTESKRKVSSRVIPAYPELARHLRIKGVVRVEATVAPNGSVKVTHILGGHPLLAQTAEEAVHKWRWEPAPSESKELVEVKFDPDNR
jgi:TonB family protein